jgi:thioesterase domain-containing protein/acyl carrier protein
VEDIDAGTGPDGYDGDDERVIKNIFSEYFGKQEVGIDDDFFDLGGDSLKAIGFIARLSERVGRKIPLQVFLNAPTIRVLMEYLRTARVGATNGAMDAERNLVRLNAESGRTLFCFPPAIGYGVSYKQLAALLPAYAFCSFDFLETEKRIEEYVSTIRSMAQGGPVVLFGYSAGGGLAFDVANHIERMGAKVSDLILLDTYVYRDFKGWENEAAPELLLEGVSGNMAGTGATADRTMAEQKIRRYYHYANTSVSEGMLSAGIHLITATDRLIEERKMISEIDAERLGRFRDFRHLTTGEYREYAGYGKHAEMLDGKFLKQNASLLGGILDEIDWSAEK